MATDTAAQATSAIFGCLRHYPVVVRPVMYLQSGVFDTCHSAKTVLKTVLSIETVAEMRNVLGFFFELTGL